MDAIDGKGPRREREPLRKHCNIPEKKYSHRGSSARGRETLKALCPSWEQDFLREVIQSIRAMATPEQVIPGVMDSACAYLPGAGVLQVHFDGTGGVMIDPASDCSPAMMELGRALKVVLGDKLTVGRPAGVME